MPARIAKFPPIQGVGYDSHMVLPPSVPPPPPAPPNPVPIPVHAWFVGIVNPVPGMAVTGKWSWHRVTTEGIGNIHYGHDWGFLQPHVPMPPILVTPSIAIRTVGSSIKYWLPSTPNKESQDGSTPGGANPVAVSTPAFVTSTQDCMDISAWGFVAPSSFSFQLVSTREVGFTLGDLAYGVIGLVGDAAVALIGSAFGQPGNAQAAGDQLQGAIVGACMGPVTGWATALIPSPPEVSEAENLFAKMMIEGAAALGSGGGPSGAATGLAKASIGYLSGKAGDAAQQAIDGPDRQGDPEAMEHGGTPLFD